MGKLLSHDLTLISEMHYDNKRKNLDKPISAQFKSQTIEQEEEISVSVSDLTSIPTEAGHSYLVIVIDLFN